MCKRRTMLSEEKIRIATKTSYVTTDEEAFKLFFEDCKLYLFLPFLYFRIPHLIESQVL